MKEIYIFTIVFTLINIYIYNYVNNIDTCIDGKKKTYIILFYGLSLLYLIYLFFKTNIKDTFTPSVEISGGIIVPSTNNPNITVDLSSNPEYSSNSSKVIYWGIDFNVNGIVDIVDKKVTLPVNNQTSLKYRIIDINEKLSNIFNIN